MAINDFNNYMRQIGDQMRWLTSLPKTGSPGQQSGGSTAPTTPSPAAPTTDRFEGITDIQRAYLRMERDDYQENNSILFGNQPLNREDFSVIVQGEDLESKLNNAEIDGAFTALDLNKDGKLDRHELAAGASVLDTDQDFALSAEELASGFAGLDKSGKQSGLKNSAAMQYEKYVFATQDTSGLSVTGKQALLKTSLWQAEHDTDGDGKISSQEFKAAMANTLGDVANDADSAKVFKLFDANNDGKLDFDEQTIAVAGMNINGDNKINTNEMSLFYRGALNNGSATEKHLDNLRKAMLLDVTAQDDSNNAYNW